MNNPPLIAIIIKTWLREGCIERLVQSIEQFLDLPYRIYVADEYPLSECRRDFYKDLGEKGHYVFVYENANPVSVTVARNFLLDQLGQEKFVLRVDDDFVLTKDTNIRLMKEILESRPEIGAVADLEIQARDAKGVLANEISDSQGYLLSGDGSLIKLKIPADRWHWCFLPSGGRYAYADFTRNMLLISRQVFNDVRWNSDLMIHGEHIDFMLSLKRAGWLLAFTPDSVHVHDDPPPSDQDARYRSARQSEISRKKADDSLLNKWGYNRLLVQSSVKSTMLLSLERVVKRFVKIKFKNTF